MFQNFSKPGESTNNRPLEEIKVPKITVITPSYNQGQFLEETIRSVLLQNYPNLEYIIIDGGSTDDSVKVIQKYQSQITYWVSEPDRGQAHAINKGFERCTGDLAGWINSDDLLLPGSLITLAEAYQQNPHCILLGDVYNFNEVVGRKKLIRQKNITFPKMIHPASSNATWHQPGVFVPSDLFKTDNVYLDESLRYLFDQDWLCRLLQKANVHYLKKPVAMFRLHSASKTINEKTLWLPEFEKVARRYWDELPGINKSKISAYFEMTRAAISLGVKHWNREKGIKHLRSSVAIYPGSIFNILFWELCLRIILPYSLLMWMRSKIKGI